MLCVNAAALRRGVACAGRPLGGALHARPTTRGKLQVVSYSLGGVSWSKRLHRDHISRADQLLSTTEEFVREWCHSVQTGPEQQVLFQLDTITDDSIELNNGGGLGGSSFHGKGSAAVRERLAQEHARLKQGGWHLTPVSVGVNDQVDVSFMLMELTLGQTAATGGHVASSPPFYEVVKLDLMLDDTAKRVMGVVSRRQLALKELSALHATRGGVATPAVVQLPNPCHLIREMLQPIPLDRAHAMALALCMARSSGTAITPLEPWLSPHFKTWDAMGLLPELTKGNPALPPNAAATPGMLDRETALDLMQKTKERYRVHCNLVDVAVGTRHNTVFVHWRSHFSPTNSAPHPSSPSTGGTSMQDSGSAGAQRFVMEGLDVLIVDPEGRHVEGLWVFRDPLDWEAAVLGVPVSQESKYYAEVA